MSRVVAVMICAGIWLLASPVASADDDDREPDSELSAIAKSLKKVSAFQFHGYLRATAATSSEGGNQVCFQLPGAPVKYRLGNECDDYTELLFRMDVYQPTSGGPYFRANTRFAFDAGALVGYQDVQLFVPELYVEGGNLFGDVLEGANLWAGKRFYREDQVHINDFWFWEFSGPGGGIEKIDVGIGKVAIAYVRMASSTSDAPPGMIAIEDRPVVSKGQVLWSDAVLYEGGSITLAVEGRQLHGPRQGVATTRGLAVYAMHEQAVLGGINQLTFQYGQGLASDLAIASDLGARNARTFRIIDSLLVEPSRHGSVALVAIYQRATGVQSHPDHWVSFGARPILNLTDHVRIALEVGADFVDPKPGDAQQLITVTRRSDLRRLTKLTIAPELAPGRRFLDRPVLRAFATYARWNRSAGDSGVVMRDSSSAPFADDRSGLTFGVQCEAWW